jgi:hypothetical protein
MRPKIEPDLGRRRLYLGMLDLGRFAMGVP